MNRAETRTGPVHREQRLTFAQAVTSNWGTNEVAGVERGFRIGLATWDLLDGRSVAELTSWLQFVPANGDDTKQLFAKMRDGRTFWARLHALSGTDDLGRRATRFWGHALVTDTIPQSCRGQSPLQWWDALPFFASLEDAKAAIVPGST
jgi:hypothetical protein